ncbi:HAD-IA family hydrolase [Bradyrhizobium diazoefficiens]|uniref:HAD family hydrolase n=1 Tax=Bradyrhizobium diazoefficiens TaxID=1355477 RepID=UPI001B8BE7D6|nr:HAD-IA family hydrolase [Bradyrhizobium diazoefficiens]MBR0865892.1 HAD-IA family hydrolase [Bradyrhizobium diazoefficiens]MBR0890422.1 HAD-IA family hydrolase [Bradyrhizobium diazoefficiens]MBR0922192.1 HAD-IA family hydrolase [Bradyrhizobium diazoefficiens]
MTAILVDLDGVLIDSWEVVEQSFLSAAAELNLDGQARLGDFRARMGMPLETIVAEFAFPADFSLHFRKAARLRDHLVRPFQGVPAMLGHMREFGLLIGVVTGKDRLRALTILETTGLVKHIDGIVTASDAPGKPQPDGLWLCEQLLGSGPSLAYIGDTTVDLQAARNAGRTPMLATWGGLRSEHEERGVIQVTHPDEVMAVIGALAGPPKRGALGQGADA